MDQSSPSASAVLLVSISSSATSSISSIVSAQTSSVYPSFTSKLNYWAASKTFLNSNAYSKVWNLIANFSSSPLSLSVKSLHAHMYAFSLLAMFFKSHDGFSVIIKLPTGLRVFSYLITNLILFWLSFLSNLAFPIPLSFHYSFLNLNSLTLYL